MLVFLDPVHNFIGYLGVKLTKNFGTFSFRHNILLFYGGSLPYARGFRKAAPFEQWGA